MTVKPRRALLSAATLAALTGTILTAGPASAATNPTCGSGFERVASATAPNAEIVLSRKGSTWCAFTRRTGSAYGATGLTRTLLSVDGGRPYVIDDGLRTYYAGPVKLTTQDGVYAVGVVGNRTEYQHTTPVVRG